jgi:hypothetical protein
MTTYRLATVPLRTPKPVHGTLDSTPEGFVIGLETPSGDVGVTRTIERSVHATSPAALRGLADLIEAWQNKA